MITASIVTYHTPLSELDTCLAALSGGNVARLYIVDNGCEESIEQWCDTHNHDDGNHAPAITYIPSPNKGYGHGHNQALRLELAGPQHSLCRYHLVINSDVDFDPSILKSIEDFMDANPNVGSLQPRMVGFDNEELYVCRQVPGPFDLILRRFLPSSWCRKSRDRYLLKNLDRTKTWNIPNHQGSFMFLRKDALKDVGLFDESFFLYAEDVDLSRRLHEKWLTLYWPNVTASHFHRATSYHSLRMMAVHICNMVKYFNKWGWLNDAQRKSFNASISEYTPSSQSSMINHAR